MRSTVARRVLVVDDDPGVVRLVRANLQVEGFEVTAAANGAECLLAVDAQYPDLIILDVMMPVLDGFQTLRLLKEKPETASIPIIMLTVRGSDADVLHGWANGVDLYLTKPFETSELIASTKRILEDREPDQAQAEEDAP
jgi:DNA-binding response OmpR family regulator